MGAFLPWARIFATGSASAFPPHLPAEQLVCPGNGFIVVETAWRLLNDRLRKLPRLRLFGWLKQVGGCDEGG